MVVVKSIIKIIVSIVDELIVVGRGQGLDEVFSKLEVCHEETVLFVLLAEGTRAISGVVGP